MPKISDLPALIRASVGDLFAVVDDAGNITKKVLATGVVPYASLNSQHMDWSETGNLWGEELKRTTLTANATSITVDGFAAKKFLMIVAYLPVDNTATQTIIRFNGDTGNTYSFRRSDDYGASAQSINTNGVGASQTAGNSSPMVLNSLVLDNIIGQEKIVSSEVVNKGAVGAGTPPAVRKSHGKWSNTANAITSVTINNGGTGNFVAGAVVVVRGKD